MPFAWEYVGEQSWLVWVGYYLVLAGILMAISTRHCDPDIYREKQSSLETGQAIPSDNDIVMNINSLQVKSSSRFVYSCTDNFDLVRQMLKENPLFKHGPRMSI